jgi:outer membrane protein insertion porin family
VVALAQEGPPISDVLVEGVRTIDPERVRALSGLSVGQPLSPRSVQRAVRALWETDLFNDVALSTRPAGGAGVVVVLSVDEAPVITGIQLEGVDKVDDKDVEAAVGLTRGDRLLEHRLHQARLDLLDLYRREGYYLAEAQLTPTRPGADSTAVEVRVDERREVAVASIRFEGNQALSDGRLREALDTETEGFWFWQDGEFVEESWREDLGQRLPEVYQQHGYLDMRVVADSIHVEPGEGEMHLVVYVDEGPQYRLGEVAIEGNSRFSRDDLERFQRLQPGEVFDASAVNQTGEDLRNLYADDGYIYAQVQPVRQVRPDTTVIDLTWMIQEGSPAKIHQVAVRGNTVTHESVIRRHLFVVPGERFRRNDIRNSLLSLEGLGFFEPGITPTTRVADQETGDIDLTFEVRERRTGSLTLGAAIGGGTGLSGFIGYEQPNLFGQGKLGSIRWEFGRRNNNLELAYTEPVFLGSKTSMSISFFNIDRRYINSPFRQDLLGGSVRFGTPLPWDDATRFYYGYKWQRIDLEAVDDDDTQFGEEYPRTDSGVTLGLVRDTRLPRLHPIQGARHSLTADMSGGPLGGTVGFQKYSFETSWFAPTLNDRTVLNLTFKVGGINETRFVPLSEQFVLGGVQPPSEGLRGYRENCVTVTAGGVDGVPCDDRGNAFVLMTAEHFIKITDTIYTSVFFDAGDVFREFRQVTFGDLKRGAGVGVQVDLPGFGPLGLDLGYGFDRFDRSGNRDPGWAFHFRFGNLLR